MQRLREPGVGIEHWRAPQLDPERIGSLLGLDVDVVEDLEMIGDEPYRRNQDGAMTLGRELLDRGDQVGPEPWLAGVTLTLVGEAPLLDAGALGDQRRGTQQLFLVGVSFIQNARRQAVRREDRNHLLGSA